MRVLVVDDDPRALRFVRNALSKAGYAPLVTGTPQDLPRIIRTERPRLVLLDLMLPEVDGIELMRLLLPELADLPVIFISAYRRDETVSKALESGAADYLVKPFSPTELVARVRAALRRREAPEPFAVGDLAVDYERRRVTVRGVPVDLTATSSNRGSGPDTDPRNRRGSSTCATHSVNAAVESSSPCFRSRSSETPTKPNPAPRGNTKRQPADRPKQENTVIS